MKTCQSCKHAQQSGFTWMCIALPIPHPTSFMRHPAGECGFEANLFEPKKDLYADIESDPA